MKLRKFLLICVLSIFCFACGFPSEEQVKNDFRSANPTYAPISAIVGEGHGDAGYYHIRYTKPNDDKTYEQVWLYLRQEDGKFKITHKESERIIK